MYCIIKSSYNFLVTKAKSNGWITCEPDSYGRTMDLPKTWPAWLMLTPIYKYAIDNWIWVSLETPKNCIVKSSFNFWVTKTKSNGRIIRESNSYGRTTDLPTTWPTRPMLTPIYKYDNWIWVWLKTPKKCSKKSEMHSKIKLHHLSYQCKI